MKYANLYSDDNHIKISTMASIRLHANNISYSIKCKPYLLDVSGLK